MSKHPCLIIAKYTIQHYWCMNNVTGEPLARAVVSTFANLLCFNGSVQWYIVLPKLLN